MLTAFKSRSWFEMLERRTLLAADLKVEVDAALAAVNPGDRLEYVVHISNLGPDDAENAQLTTNATTILEDVSWTREDSFLPDFDAADLAGLDGLTIEGAAPQQQLGQLATSVGDFNGDGVDDLLVTSSTDRDKLSGTTVAYLIFGGQATSEETLSAPELDGTNGFALMNPAGGMTSVAGAGDVNGDGFMDLLIGSPYDQKNRWRNDGTTYVVFGSDKPFDAQVDLQELNGGDGFAISSAMLDSLYGPTRAQTGFSVDGAGDVNGDGLDDIIIGTGLTLEPAAYVVFGSRGPFEERFELTELDGSNGFRLREQLERRDNYTGYSVSGAGDVNGDGLDDVAVGHNGYTDPVYVVFGSREARPSTVDLLKIREGDGFRFDGGWGLQITDGRSEVAVSRAGDVNGDGYDDVLIGSPKMSGEGAYAAGAAYVVFGREEFAPRLRSSSLDGTNGFAMRGTTGFEFLGNDVQGVGDINGDGLDDIHIGRFSYRPAFPPDYIVFGGREYVARLEPSKIDGRNGTAFKYESGEFLNVAPAGDFNNDGISDLLVEKTGGSAFVMFGHSSPTTERSTGIGNVPNTLDVAANSVAKFTITGTVPISASESLSLTSSIGVGADQTDSVRENNVDTESVLLLREVDLQIGGPEPSVGVAGDPVSFTFTVTNNGTADAVVDVESGLSESLENVTWTRRSVSPVSSHPATYDATKADGVSSFNIRGGPGGPTTSSFGDSSASAGDVNGDGLMDIAIGERWGNAFGDNAGAVYILFGSSEAFPPDYTPRWDGSDGFVIRGAAGMRLGWQLSSAGDVNGDGFDDLLLSGRRAPWAYLIFGKQHFDRWIDVGNLAPSDGISFVHSVGKNESYVGVSGVVGDINHDGLDDIAITGNNPGDREPMVFVVFGQRNWDASFDLRTLNGENGFSISNARTAAAAGDFNGDGIDDMMVTRSTNSYSSDVVVVFGRTDFPATLSATNSDNLRFRPSPGMDAWAGPFGPAGDVNGDGLADLLVGAGGDIPADVVHTGVTVILGEAGAATDWSRVDLTISGTDGAADQVSRIGDINGDGIDDILVSGNKKKFHRERQNAESYVVFGSRKLLDSEFTLEQLDGTNGFAIEHDTWAPPIPRSIGDFNGDGVPDFFFSWFPLAHVWFGAHNCRRGIRRGQRRGHTEHRAQHDRHLHHSRTSEVKRGRIDTHKPLHSNCPGRTPN